MNNIFEESFKKLIEEHYFIVLLLISILIILGLLYCFVRAGTGNFVRTRIWNFFAGTYDFNDRITSDLWSEVRDVENFRFNTGMKFKSKHEIKKFHLWLEHYNIPIYEAMKVSRFFNVQRNYFIAYDFKGRFIRRLYAVMAFALLLVAINALYGSIRNNAYLTIKSNDFSFVYKGDSVNVYNKEINIDFCKNFKKDGFDYNVGTNISVICKLLIEDESNEYYRSVIKNQKHLFFIIFFVNIFLVFYFLKSAFNYDVAENFKREYIESKLN